MLLFGWERWAIFTIGLCDEVFYFRSVGINARLLVLDVSKLLRSGMANSFFILGVISYIRCLQPADLITF